MEKKGRNNCIFFRAKNYSKEKNFFNVPVCCNRLIRAEIDDYTTLVLLGKGCFTCFECLTMLRSSKIDHRH